MSVFMDSIACAYGERVDEGNIWIYWMTQEIAALVNDCIGPCIPIMKGGATLAIIANLAICALDYALP